MSNILDFSPRFVDLKIKVRFFDSVAANTKTFEVRKNDKLRPYKIGDVLVLREVNEEDQYTGRVCTRQVSYILYGGQYGLDEDYVIMSIVPF